MQFRHGRLAFGVLLVVVAGVMPPHCADACADVVCQETDCLNAGTCTNGICSVGSPKDDGTSCSAGTCQQGVCTGGYILVSMWCMVWWVLLGIGGICGMHSCSLLFFLQIHHHSDCLPLAAPGYLHPTDPCAGVVCQTTQCRNAGVCTDGACSQGEAKEDGISCDGGTCQQGVCIGS